MQYKIKRIVSMVIAFVMVAGLFQNFSAATAFANAPGAISVTFMLSGATADGPETWVESDHFTIPVGSTAQDLFQMVLAENNIPYTFFGDWIGTIGGIGMDSFVPGSGWTFSLNGEMAMSAMGQTTLNDGDFLVVSFVMDWTAPANFTVGISAIPGITPPVYGEIPVTTIETSQYTATVAWCPPHPTFELNTEYTATITLIPKTGVFVEFMVVNYTLAGLPPNFFRVAGAANVTNARDCGIVTAVFPAENMKDGLGEIIAAAYALNFYDFTNDSWTNLQAALSVAKSVYINPLATLEQINSAAATLQEALDNLLGAAPPNLLLLEQAINQAAALSEANYTPNSWAVLAAALNQANDIHALAISEAANAYGPFTVNQFTVNNAAFYLQNAIYALTEIADTAALQILVNLAATHTEADYTPISWAVFENALAKANNTLANLNASQAEVNAALLNLQNAISALRKPSYEGDALKNVLEFMQNRFENLPDRGDWFIVAMARSGKIDANSAIAVNYLAQLEVALSTVAPGQVTFPSLNENARVVLALTALGLDAEDWLGYNFVSALTQILPNGAPAAATGNLGASFALIALDSGNYEDTAIREKLIEYLLNNKNNGGWGWGDGASLPMADATAMAMQALAPYYSIPTVGAALNEAAAWLLAQNVTGAEDNAQIIIALTALGTDNNLIRPYVEALLEYQDAATGAFMFMGTTNDISTEQAAKALVAYDRFLHGLNSLFDMSDAADTGGTGQPQEADKTALLALITEAEKIVNQYTAITWSAFQQALNNARAVAANPRASQPAVDVAERALYQAIDGLVESSDTGDTMHMIVRDPQGATFFDEQVEIQSGFTNAMDALFESGLDIVTNAARTYVISIEGLAEFDHGPGSGWMMRINDEFLDASARHIIVNYGDLVEWLYTRDFGYDLKPDSGSGGGQHGGGFGSGDHSHIPPETERQPEVVPDAEAPETEPETPIRFADLPENHWAIEHINLLSSRGIMIGTGDGMFEPEREITRAEFVTLLFMLTGEERPPGITRFTDVPVSAWYATFVAWASNHGITDGTCETTFSPAVSISRQHMAIMMLRFMDIMEIGIIEIDPDYTMIEFEVFADDGDIAPYAREFVYALRRMGIISGMDDRTFAPREGTTRAQAAAIIARILKIMEVE